MSHLKSPKRCKKTAHAQLQVGLTFFLLLCADVSSVLSNSPLILGRKNPPGNAFASHKSPIAVPATTDLESVTRNARDGDVIQLEPGRYSGSLVVENKSITIRGAKNGKTVSMRGKGAIAVLVKKGGRLQMENAHFDGKDVIHVAMSITEGQAELRQCTARGLTNFAYVSRGRLQLDQCQVTGSKSHVVKATNQSTLVCRNSQFSKTGSYGIVAKDNCQVKIENCKFDQIAASAILGFQANSFTVNNSKFHSVSKRGIEAQSGTLTVTGSDFQATGENAIAAFKGAAVSVNKCKFHDSKKTAVYCKATSKVHVEDSEFEDNYSCIRTYEGSTNVSIVKNSIRQSTEDRQAIRVTTVGQTSIINNFLLQPVRGIGINAPVRESVLIKDNLIVEPKICGIWIEVRSSGTTSPISVANNKILNAANCGLIINKTPVVNVTDNIILSSGKTAVSVQNASAARFKGNVLYATDNSVFFFTSSNKSVLDRDIVLAPIYPESGPYDASGIERHLALLKDNKLRQRLVATVKELNKTTSNEDLPKHDVLGIGIEKLQKEVELFNDRAAKLSSIRMIATDRVGRESNTEFSIVDIDGKVVSKHGGTQPTAMLPPGDYFVQAEFDPNHFEEVSLKANESKVVKITAPNHLTLTMSKMKNGVYSCDPVFIELKNNEQLKRTLRDHRSSDLCRNQAALRANVSQAQKQRALQLARKLDKAYWNNYVSCMQRREYSKAFQWQEASRWATDIITNLGDASDFDRLMGFENQDTTSALSSIAYMENRMGTLDSGYLCQMLDDKDEDKALKVAAVLQANGVSKGQNMLIHYLRKPEKPWHIPMVVDALLSTDDPQVLIAIRQLAKECLAAQTEAEKSGRMNEYVYRPRSRVASSVMAYLFAHGNENDWQTAARLVVGWDKIGSFIPFVRNSLPISKLSIGQDFKSRSDILPALRWYGASLRNIRDQGDDYYAATRTEVRKRLAEIGNKCNVSNRNDKFDRLMAVAMFNIDSSAFDPNSVAASYVLIKQRDNWLQRSMTWIPRPWQINQHAKEVVKRNFDTLKGGGNYHFLDYVPCDELEQALKRNGASIQSDYIQLFLARHRTMTHGFWTGRYERAFVCGSKNGTGALSGYIKIHPTLKGKTLQVRISTKTAVYVKGGLDVAISGEGKVFNNIPARGNKEMFNAVVAHRNGKSFPLTYRRTESNGDFVFETKLDQSTLNNLCLNIDFKFVDQNWPLDFNLFTVDKFN